MRKPPPLPEGSKEKLRVLLKTARTKEQYRQVLCLWLRAAFQLNSAPIGEMLGLTEWGVRDVWRLWVQKGEAMFKRPGKGGRHRQNMTWSAERKFLVNLLKQTGPANALLEARLIQEAYEKMVGHAVSSSVVYRMLKRHNWRRASEGQIFTPQRWAAARLFFDDTPAEMQHSQ